MARFFFLDLKKSFGEFNLVLFINFKKICITPRKVKYSIQEKERLRGRSFIPLIGHFHLSIYESILLQSLRIFLFYIAYQNISPFIENYTDALKYESVDDANNIIEIYGMLTSYCMSVAFLKQKVKYNLFCHNLFYIYFVFVCFV